MAPPPRLPRIQDLNAEDVADAVVETVLAAVERQASRLSPIRVSLMPSIEGPDERAARLKTRLGMAARELTDWAKTGNGIGIARARAAMTVVLQSLKERALDLLDEEPGDFDADGAPINPIAVMLLAARCRSRLDSGDSVTPRELGTLAGLNERRLRQILQEGELRRDPTGRIRPRDATSWLTKRRVPGFPRGDRR